MFTKPAYNEGETATLVGRFSDAGTLDTHTVVIAWGDGTSSNATVNPSDRTFTATRVYVDDAPTATAFDIFNANITVTDNEGASVQQAVSVRINNVAPTIGNLSISTPIIKKRFRSNQRYVRGCGQRRYDQHHDYWGDGTSSPATLNTTNKSFTATHRYLDDNPNDQNSNAYVITATITDDDGGTASQVLERLITHTLGDTTAIKTPSPRHAPPTIRWPH